MIYENPSSHRARWIKKMILFNFTIYYRSEVKIGYANFTFKMKTFLFKNNISDNISTLRKQKLSEYLLPK